ncbi:MAG: Gmad2 immunoglobulin-like domain-containing protein [Patescibacteria group bacterium]|nr:Gmad2 immunoglobulin-like domain-containing protein [Patescibacteria group bacterium]MDD4304484.1 Gmad2 immunoglobulin-like domain-containing protein [Patescibacteria group bacterium]MDD4694844.1 Gmad2 immunoglobulin-like domain-containing protein [Patescibacteria group bacterium]
MKHGKIFISIGVFLTILILFTFYYYKNTQKINSDFGKNLQEICVGNGGDWIGKYNECEMINEDICKNIGGLFFECKSACRHNLDPNIICTMRCVPVCEFSNNNLNTTSDSKNATYYINGEYIILKDGNFEGNIPNSKSKMIVSILGDVVFGDLNSDGIDDSAFIVTQKMGGSGIFYYVVSAIKNANNYIGTNGVFLGDRINTKSISIKDGFVVLNYFDRKDKEDFSVEPSVLFVKQLGIENGILKDMMNIDSNNYSNKIKLFSPLPGEKIKSPLILEGEARGNWFFEASFPVVLTDWDGVIIAQGIAQAEGEWMTEDFVKFKAELNFKKPELYNRGALILKKDNPSGLSENDDAYEITIFFE